MNRPPTAVLERSPSTVGLGCAAVAFALAPVLARDPFGGALWPLVLLPAILAMTVGGIRWGMAVLAAAAAGPVVLAMSPLVDSASIDLPATAVRTLILFVLLVAMVRLPIADLSARPVVRVDEATGLANARALFESISAEVERAQRYSRPFTIAYVSIENLATLRQRYGESEVSEAMRRAAHQIKGSLRGADLVARLREREFALLFPETGPEAARTVLSRIERLLEVSLTQEEHPLSYAVGAISWVHADLSAEALHQRTYQLMYAARQSGRTLNHEILDEENFGEAPHQYLPTRAASRGERSG